MSSEMFGLFVFDRNSQVVYRFTNSAVSEHLDECFKRRYKNQYGDGVSEAERDPNELPPTYDDILAQHLGTLLRVHDYSIVTPDPIRRIRLENGAQIFFDELKTDHLICMAGSSFDTIIVLKTMNLFKALVKYHLGVLSFTYNNANNQLINRISAALQYFLNHVTTNQALLFESCENLYINSLIRNQCRETCTAVSEEMQRILKVARPIVLITCKDKIVHMHLSSENTRLSNADLFLLLLSTNSRCYREGFDSQTKISGVMAHTYDTNISDHRSTGTHSARPSVDTQPSPFKERTSCPGFSPEELAEARNNLKRNYRSEVVFIETSNYALAPFTLFTGPIKDDLNILILAQWEMSGLCSNLYRLISHLDSCTRNCTMSSEQLPLQVRAVETNGDFRRYLKSKGRAGNVLSETLQIAIAHYKESIKTTNKQEEREQYAVKTITQLTNISREAASAFEDFFFKRDEYGKRSSVDTEVSSPADPEMDNPDEMENQTRKNEYDALAMMKKVSRIVNNKLRDWFDFIQVKAQRNITMNFCQRNFPGLVHFLFIDRRRGLICTPTLIPDDLPPLPNSEASTNEYTLQKKILAFELECLAVLQNGFTSYTVGDQHFIYNYALLLQESNGAVMRMYKPFIKTHPPGILHFDFYNSLVKDYHPSQSNQGSITCLELIAVHLNVVPPSIIRDQFERLWQRLMEYDE